MVRRTLTLSGVGLVIFWVLTQSLATPTITEWYVWVIGIIGVGLIALSGKFNRELLHVALLTGLPMTFYMLWAIPGVPISGHAQFCAYAGLALIVAVNLFP